MTCHPGTGTWVRFPGPLIYFTIFALVCSSVALIQRSTIRPTPWLATRPEVPIQGPGWAVHHGHQSTTPHTRQKSQKGLILVGQKCFNTPPKRAWYPLPWFALFLISILISFNFLMFNYFFYLIHKIIFII